MRVELQREPGRGRAASAVRSNLSKECAMMPDVTRRDLLAMASALPVAAIASQAGAQAAPLRSFLHRARGSDWHCAQRGRGPAVVLVPSGAGDGGRLE